MAGYVGSGPYCYSNALSMLLGEQAPPVGVLETLTGAPFGVQAIGGTLPLFDPYGWDPDLGLSAAVELLGWRCVREEGGTAGEALARLRAACDGAGSPGVLVGPVDMTLLPYLSDVPPTGTDGTEGSGGAAYEAVDHYLVVLGFEGDTVRAHDPHGHPYATLPATALAAAWEAKAVDYTDAPYVMRSGFVRERQVTVAEALWNALPAAVAWLGGVRAPGMPPGSLSGAAAVERLAGQVERGLDGGTRTLLTGFAVRVGARRCADAADCLASLGLTRAASVAAGQARLLGALQYPLATGDDPGASAVLRRLAPTYAQLRAALGEAIGEADSGATGQRAAAPAR